MRARVEKVDVLGWNKSIVIYLYLLLSCMYDITVSLLSIYLLGKVSLCLLIFLWFYRRCFSMLINLLSVTALFDVSAFIIFYFYYLIWFFCFYYFWLFSWEFFWCVFWFCVFMFFTVFDDFNGFLSKWFWCGLVVVMFLCLLL